MNRFAHCLNVLLVVVLLLTGSGCETLEDKSLTCNLWHKDPTASPAAIAEGKDYLYGPLARTTLTPLAVAGDATAAAAVLGVVLGIACVVDACQNGAQEGGRAY